VIDFGIDRRVEICQTDQEACDRSDCVDENEMDDLSGNDPNDSDWNDGERSLRDNDDIVDRDVAPVNVELKDTENHRNGENVLFIPRRSARLMLKDAHPQGNVSRIVDRREEKMIPNIVKEGMSGRFATMWDEAMRTELENIKAQNTWSVVKRPRDANVVGCKWVFALKRDQKGNIQRFKARLVAEGFKQKYGVDYFETSSPMMQRKTLRLLLIAWAVEGGWEMSQVNVVGAYSNST